MSWQEDIENIVFTIITGDGKQWQPKWKPTGRSTEYNTATFEFIKVKGSLVLREEPKGIKHDLEFYFDGENAVTTGNAFELSSRNKKAWLIRHPFYGNIQCQPLVVNQDNSQLNCSKFTISVIETINDIYPIQMPVIQDRVLESVIVANQAQESIFKTFGQLNKNAITDNISKFDTIYSKIIGVDSELLAFKSLVSNALIEIESVSATPLSIIRASIAVINYPATIQQTVESRINTYNESLDYLYNSITGTQENKLRYEVLGGSMVGAALIASSSNIDSDYDTRNNIFNIQNKISAIYSTFLARLDSLQTLTVDSPTSYTPNYANMSALNTVVNYTISNLFNLAYDAKQEREYIVDYDSNLILLTHRFYGLDGQDANIDKFIKTNNIGLEEMLCISKGRKIIYYV